ncbi:MAG: RluA family pseudouridine synthase [Verrucomicrobiota bacterium]
MLFEIIHEDPDLLVVNKPAGLVCHPTKGDQFSSLISRARLHCGEATTAHLVNRLDRETSGVVLIAKNSTTAGALGKIWESRAVQKEYLAIVHGHVPEKNGVIDQPLGKDVKSIVAIKDCVRPDGASAKTEFEVLQHINREDQKFSYLKIHPLTGRKHQIRIHLAYLGHPIVGDKIYGLEVDAYLALVQNRITLEQWEKLILPNQALHARSVRFTQLGREQVFCAEPEELFKQFLRSGVPKVLL